MKRSVLILVPAALLLVLAAVGCNDESNPALTRIVVSPSCGVAPLQVDCFAAASGGNESGDPTGGNNNLELTWSFGDGGTGNTSIAFHEYLDPGDYTVTVTAKDPDGKTAVLSTPVTVLADTLLVTPETNFPGGVATTADTVAFNCLVDACSIDPANDNDYRNLAFLWEMNNASENVYSMRAPRFRFFTAGDYVVELTVTLPSLAVTRHVQIPLTITDP